MTRIAIGCLHHSFYEVAARVVSARLQEAGFEVALHLGAHAELYPRLAGGELDLMIASWLPHLHGPFYEPVKHRIVCIARCFEDACAFWAVPDYVPERTVSTVGDLTLPDVAAKMDRRISAAAGAVAVCDRAREVYETYQLRSAGYEFVPLEADAAWIEEIRSRFEAGQWFATPLWRPHFLNRVLRMRRLAEPRGIMGGSDTGWLTGNRRFVESAPKDLLDNLKALDIGLDGITEMDVLVNVDGLTPEEAATAWRAQRQHGA